MQNDLSKAISKYSAFFWREPTYVREPIAEIPVAVCRFPSVTVGFFKRLVTPYPERTVYITAGMSTRPMPVPVEERKTYSDRIELIAICDAPIGVGESSEDVPSLLLQSLIGLITDRNIFIGPTHTVDFGEPINVNYPMTGFFFSVPDLDIRRLCRCSPAAQDVVSVIPITAPELELARGQGVEALIERFEERGVPPLFDIFRSSVA